MINPRGIYIYLYMERVDKRSNIFIIKISDENIFSVKYFASRENEITFHK